MNDFHNLEMLGFCKPVLLSELWESKCREVSRVPGVYIVARKDETQPRFLALNPGVYIEPRDATVPPDELHKNWVDGAIVLYIGQSGSSLKQRILDFLKFGHGIAARHWGGRFIWQIDGAYKLVMCWKPTLGMKLGQVEKQLLKEFETLYDRLPFANLRR